MGPRAPAAKETNKIRRSESLKSHRGSLPSILKAEGKHVCLPVMRGSKDADFVSHHLCSGGSSAMQLLLGCPCS